MVTFVGSAVAEIFSVPFYYPFDLIKVRMQTSHAKYGYNNLIDGVIKIWHEKNIPNKNLDRIKQ